MQTQPFHSGELEAQARAGETVLAKRNSGAVREAIPSGARQFIREQQIAVLAREDADDRIWCSVTFGHKGFLQPSEDLRRLTLERGLASRRNEDPVWHDLQSGEQIGVLLIDLATRRRLKINGISELTGTGLAVNVTESFPLCPKYIQKRTVHVEGSATSERTTLTGTGEHFGPEQMQTMRSADTFFVASTHVERGPDASHRGGLPGFVEVLSESVLRIPDYPGNGMFNTFGNLLLDDRAGLVFVDFTRRVLLQLTGHAQIFWDQSDAAEDTGGTKRLWHFHSERWQESSLPSEVMGR